MILCETIGDYSQTIRIGNKNQVEVYKDSKELFKGEVTNLSDNGNVLSFKDINGKEYKFVKYNLQTR